VREITTLLVNLFKFKFFKMANETTSTASNGSGLDPKVSSLLSWILGGTIIVPLILAVIEKDKFAKFNAWESLIWTIASTVVVFVVYTIISFVTFGIGGLCFPILFVPFLGNIYGAVKAYNGEMWKIPTIGDFAEQLASK